jgi:hypothetical protein
MMTIHKLHAMPYAQAEIRCYDDNSVTLISYTTAVAYIDPQGWLCINGLYSATTRRHIGAFVKQYANISYQLAKELYLKNMAYNIMTGEVIDLC